MASEKVKSGARNVKVGRDRDGQRLDNFVGRHFPGLPRSVIYRVIRTGQVRINGGRSKPSTRLQAGDEVRLPPAHINKPKEGKVPDSVLRQLETAILYEDDELLAIDKPAGLAVHAGSGITWGVVDVIRKLRPDAGVDLAHRIDRETSGCLLFAKDAATLRRLHDQFRTGVPVKRYLCLMHGRLKEDKVIVDEPLARIERSGERFMVVDESGKPARTEFRLLQSYGGYSYVEALPETGRTHQIRAHAAWLGLPLAGDDRYATEGQMKFWRARGLKRLFLHAHSLTIEDAEGAPVQFSCHLPTELRAILDGL